MKPLRPPLRREITASWMFPGSIGDTKACSVRGMFQAALLVTASFGAAVPCGSGVGCTVDAEVAGGRLELKVDTGADITVLTDKAARRAGLRVTKDDPVVILSGASQKFAGILARADVRVGDHLEKDTLVVVAPGLKVGSVDGLLGMSFLERFRVTVADALELTPIDAGDVDRRGGRGERWWRLVFSKVRGRRAEYERALVSAQQLDREMERQFGVATSGQTLSARVRKLRDFMQAYERRLYNKAARHSVPRPWREGR